MCQQVNGSQPKKEREPVTGHETGNERAILVDALGRPIPLEGDLKVWLDDDLVDRRAPEGWVHLTNVREVCLAILSGRVVELSLDNDLSDDKKYGQGSQVVTFLEDNQGVVLVRFRQHLIPAVRLLGKGEAHVENEQALPRPVQARSG